jgi:hypothetical protein
MTYMLSTNVNKTIIVNNKTLALELTNRVGRGNLLRRRLVEDKNASSIMTVGIFNIGRLWKIHKFEFIRPAYA